MGQTEPMETRQWMNRGQPQTLQVAVFLLYFGAIFGLLFGDNRGWYQVALVQVLNSSSGIDLGRVVWFAAVVAAAAGGYGIANEKKWGYWLGLAAAAAPLTARFIVLVTLQISPFESDVISLLFDIALFILLLHPQSRDYQRIWFK